MNFPAAAEPLLVAADARVTCPACQGEFSLVEGFASRSFEQLRQASVGRLEELRRVAHEAEAARAGVAVAAGARELESLKALIAERDAEHARQLRETRALEQRSSLAQLETLRQSLAERDARIGDFVARAQRLEEQALELNLREQEFASRVSRAAHEEAQRLAQTERDAFASELNVLRAQAHDVRVRELELLRERPALIAARETAELDANRRVELARQAALLEARDAESERWKLKEAEYQKKLEDTAKRLEDAQRAAAQGSQQLQGEVLELLLEEQLRSAFPLDSIEEVKKGARGGDVIHRVMTRTGQQAGVILWEAKRAQNWSREWALKLKADLLALGAEVGVIVTLVMPKECPAGAPFDLYEDVWVTTPGAVLALGKVLASALADVHKQRLVSANKGEKMEAVYDYVTSAQFGHKIRAVATTLRRLREELESERTQTLQRWSRREKQIQQAVVELAGIGGDLQGLAQHDLPQLEIEPGSIESLAR